MTPESLKHLLIGAVQAKKAFSECMLIFDKADRDGLMANKNGIEERFRNIFMTGGQAALDRVLAECRQMKDEKDEKHDWMKEGF